MTSWEGSSACTFQTRGAVQACGHQSMAIRTERDRLDGAPMATQHGMQQGRTRLEIFQSRTEWSSLAVTNQPPPGLTATAVIGPSCPLSGRPPTPYSASRRLCSAGMTGEIERLSMR